MDLTSMEFDEIPGEGEAKARAPRHPVETAI